MDVIPARDRPPKRIPSLDLADYVVDLSDMDVPVLSDLEVTNSGVPAPVETVNEGPEEPRKTISDVPPRDHHSRRLRVRITPPHHL